MASNDSESLIIDPVTMRAFGRSLYLVIPLDDPEVCIQKAIQQSMQVEKRVLQAFKGELSFWDYLEAVESYVSDIDGYCDEVEENMEDFLELVRS